MTLDELFASLRERAVRLFRRDASVLVSPPGGLKPEERAFVAANVAAVIAALDAEHKPPREETIATLTVDEILHRDEEALERSRAARMAPPPPVVMFATHNGPLPLRLLSAEQVKRFEAAGKLSAAEVVEWSKTRRTP